MIIESHAIGMKVKHLHSETTTLERQLDVQSLSEFKNFFVDARGAQSVDTASLTELRGTAEANPKQIDLLQQYQRTARRLFESLIQAINPNRDRATNVNGQLLPSAIHRDPSGSMSPMPDAQERPVQAAQVPRDRPVMQLVFNVTEQFTEYECTEFKSCGWVKTQDGRSIDFSLSLTMERRFESQRSFETTQVVFKDPLILNFEGESAELSDQQFAFDLTAEGESEWISYLEGDSAMLALDRNGDGEITDGTELFGAISGDGFADLAEFDDDENGFIDAGDAIFDQLALWYARPESNTLVSLADKGIGALYLGSEASPFQLKGAQNETLGRVRSSGIYLTEAGQVGTLQQIDLAV